MYEEFNEDKVSKKKAAFVAQEVFKKQIANMDADYLTPERAVRLYDEIFKRVLKEQENILGQESVNISNVPEDTTGSGSLFTEFDNDDFRFSK